MTPLEALAATTEGLFNSLAGWTGVSSANAPSDSRPSTSAPLPGSKILLFIRHGQGHHNPRDNLFSLEWVYHTLLTRDSDLTPKGVAQAHEARRQLLESDSLGEVEVVFVSPLSRAIATADLIFSGRGGAGAEATPAAATRAPRLHLCAELTERKWFLCDAGSPKEALLQRHPYLASPPWQGGVDALAEHWWPDTNFERPSELAARTSALTQMLLGRPESVVACVGHGAFFRELIRERLPNATPRYVELTADGRYINRPEWTRPPAAAAAGPGSA